MPVVSMRDLLEAGVHFGHQTRRWNPKMRRFIFTERGGIYIIDLQQTAQLIDRAYDFARDLAARGGTMLFVGTKKQAMDAVAEEAERVGMPYVNHRWLGGLLTNWRTMSARIERMHELRRLKEEGQLELLPAKERLTMLSELEKLEANLGGVADLKRQPDALFVGTKKQSQDAIAEHAARVGMPYVNHRWLGGLLTNWRTMASRIERMHELRRLKDEGQLDLLPAKERLTMLSELEKLEANLGGVGDLKRQPDAVFVVDLRKEQIAVREARRLGLPLIGLVDTNCDPDEVDYVIPGNDDAIRSCSLVIKAIAKAIEDGRSQVRPEEFEAAAATNGQPEEAQAPAEAAAEEPAAEEPAAEEPAADETPVEHEPMGQAESAAETEAAEEKEPADA